MDHFIDSVLFAAGMTMLDALKQPQEPPETTGRAEQDEQELLPKVNQLDKDPANTYARLCDLLESIFQSTDEVTGYEAGINAKDIIDGILFHIFRTAIKDVDAPVAVKIKAFDTALHYCNVPYRFSPGQLFTSSDGEMSQKLAELFDAAFPLIIESAHVSGRGNDGLALIKALAELVNLAEEAVYLKMDGFTFTKKAAHIALEKPIEHLEKTKRRMEEEEPELKDLSRQETQEDKVNKLLAEARAHMEHNQMHLAQQKYRDILAINPYFWEAVFYSEFCALAVSSPAEVQPSTIPTNTIHITRAAERAIPLSKTQLHTRADLLTYIGSMSTAITGLATNYYAAAMNLYKANPQALHANEDKINRVQAIIQMLFSVGDAFEASYSEIKDLFNLSAYACWRVGLLCYESCDMPQPQGAYEHLMKMQQVDPFYQCKKEISSAGSGEYTPKAESKSGCYIATCAYGSYDCPQVWTLRRFRDQLLAKSIGGRAAIHLYYAVSPKIVKCFGKNRLFTKTARALLDVLVNKLKRCGFSSLPYED